jgi:hypothetical protein
MRAVHWRYVLLDNGAGAAALNLGINGAIAWVMFHGAATVPLWGAVGIASDTAATSLILPFLTCVIVTALTDWHVRAGRLTSLPPRAARPQGRARSLARWLPEATWARAGVFAVASLVLLVPMTLLAFVGLGIDRLPFERFVVFKAAFAVANGLLVTPWIAVLALSRRAA